MLSNSVFMGIFYNFHGYILLFSWVYFIVYFTVFMGIFYSFHGYILLFSWVYFWVYFTVFIGIFYCFHGYILKFSWVYFTVWFVFDKGRSIGNVRNSVIYVLSLFFMRKILIF